MGIAQASGVGLKSLLLFRDTETGKTSGTLEVLRSGRSRRLDIEALAAHLLFDAALPMERTVYEGLTCEPSADAWGELAESEIRAGEEDPARALIDVLVRSIERAVEGVDRVAVLAGGGIDSSGLLALTIDVMRRRGGSVFAVALDFESPGDDRPHLRLLEAHLGCEVVRVEPREGAAHLAHVRDGVDGLPLVCPFGPVQIALYEAARRHGAERLLTGAGGDHLFDGSPTALADLARTRPLRAVRAARTLEGFDELRFPTLQWVVRPLVVPFVPRSLRRFVARRRRAPHSVDAWAGPRLREMDERLWERKLELALAPPPPTDTAAYFRHPQRRHFLSTVHQEQRAGGLRRLDPYFTHEVASVLGAMPPEVLLTGGRRRGLFREALRGSLPDSVLDRPDKADFGPAFATFFDAAGGARAFARELEGRTLGRLGLVDRSVFTREATRALEAAADDVAYGYAWAAVATEAFLSQHPELT